VWRRLVVAITLICFGGCASTATIARTDAPDNEAEIARSDADALYLLARNERIHRIPRESIAGIDHPGNVEILVGGILLGLFTIAAVGIRNDRDKNEVIVPLAIVYGGPGLALLLSGMLRYIPSVQAARAFESAPRPAPLPPTLRAPMPGPYAAPPGLVPSPPPLPAPAPIAPPAPSEPERAPEPEVTPSPETSPDAT
jgi:hypothetical protein